MKKGYYTDQAGHCIGYWELTEKPQNGTYFWVESAELPPIYVSELKIREAKIKEIDKALAIIDNKSIRALRTGDTARLTSLENQAVVLRAERSMYE